jgi:inhibitor of cysteine peptidase
LTILLLGASCAGDAGSRIEVTAEDRGRTIRLEPSQELVVTLASNPSTGFRWILSEEPDPGILELVGSTYVEPETDLLGAPGEEVWTLRAVEPGRTSFVLRYERSSGERSGAPFELAVDVG